jgi:hypothetical protein
MGEINMNKDFLTMIISLTVIIIFLTGCIEEETTVSTETPTAIESPTSLITPMETLTPTAIPTLEAAWKLNVTLKSGYKWYQNDELYYGFAYPENWEILQNFDLIEGQESVVMFMPENLEPSPEDMGMPYITVVIYSNSSQSRWWENPDTGSMGFGTSGIKGGLSLENGTEKGIISHYGPVTINDRDGFEVIHDPIMFVGFSRTPVATARYIVFTVDDLDYTIMAISKNELYSTYEDIFEEVINSFIIR